MELQGRIKLINETQTFGSNGFRKREIVVTTDEKYPQDILVEFVQDKTEILDKYNVGDNVNVSINLRGRDWVNPQGETKYFNSIVGWRIEKVNAGTKPIPAPAETFEPVSDLKLGDNDDLPF